MRRIAASQTAEGRDIARDEVSVKRFINESKGRSQCFRILIS